MMYISTYNNNGLDDVLMILFKKTNLQEQSYGRRNDTVTIRDKKTKEVVGVNVFNASTYLEGLTNGPVTLEGKNLEVVNQLLEEAGAEKTLTENTDPTFVVGHVKSCKPVEGSDHLNVTETEVDKGEVLQIVCGASNIAEGQKVVVAKVGAVMPEGLVIWPGELKGVKSEGMICSARELGLPQESSGIMVLDDSEPTGFPFQFKQ